MKKILYLTASLLALTHTSIFGQALTPEQQVLKIEAQRQSYPQLASPKIGMPPGRLPSYSTGMPGRLLAETEIATLTKFNLDFAGGQPELLVKAIEKATGKPLNVIVSGNDAKVDLPPLKLNNVSVVELFNALQSASMKVESYVGGSPYMGISPSYQQMTTYYGFKTDGPVTDDSIWYFVVTKPTMLPEIPTQKICRFYPLAEYLNRGFTVDDITTAIQTGWKMSGDPAKPELNYHKETKLLIAFGEPEKLNVIDEVLKALQPQPEDSSAVIRSLFENRRQPEIPTPVDPTTLPATNSPEEKSGK